MYSLILILALTLGVYAQDATKVWTKQPGTNSNDYSYGVAVDSSSNIYITGYTFGNLDGNIKAGFNDMFLMKYDTNGNKLWTKVSGTTVAACSYSVAVDSLSNIYITGSASGEFDGNPDTGWGNVFLQKYGTNGNKLWTKVFGSSDVDCGNSITTDISGNIFITGYVTGSLNGNPYLGRNDIFLIKFDNHGNVSWTKQLGTDLDDSGYGVAVDSSSNIYITGYTKGNLDGNINAGEDDIFLIKYDTNGNKLWTKLSGTTAFDRSYGIAIDSSGNIYLAGYTGGNLDGNANPGGDDTFIMKYDTNGNKLWTKLTGAFRCYGISVDSLGNVYLTGYTDGNLDGNINAGISDIFLQKYDTNGNKLWSLLSGTSATDVGRGVSVDTIGNIYITGYTLGNLDGNPNAGMSDIFLTKYIKQGFSTITVTYPNGGESWQVGAQKTVTWTYTGTVGNVNIDLSTDGGTNWTSLVSSTTNNGSQVIAVPNLLSTTCKIRVQETDGSPSDISDNNFTITSTTVLTPTIFVSTSSLDFGEVKLGEKKSLPLAITNTGAGTLTGTITCVPDWISVEPANFNSNLVSISVTVDNSALKQKDGQHTGKITITSNGGSPMEIPVTLTATCVLPKPNPYNPAKGNLTFFGDGIVPDNTTIKIYTLNGDLIKVLRNRFEWDGSNENGKTVADGIYIYTYESPKEKGIGKFTLIY